MKRPTSGKRPAQGRQPGRGGGHRCRHPGLRCWRVTCKDVLLLDVTPLSLGIETHGRQDDDAADREEHDDSRPRSRETFTTADDNQNAVTIQVVPGRARGGFRPTSLLGRFDLADIPPAPRGMPQIEVTFDLDANGILHVSAQDKATGKEQSIRITASGGLSDEDIEQMVADAEANAEADARFEELITARNTCDGLIHAARKTIEEAGEHATDDEKAAIEAAITEAEEAVKGDDKEAIDAAATKLTEATGPVAQKMYAAQAEQAQAAGAGAEAGAGAGHAEPADDVVDAEFEEVKDDDKK